MIIPH